MHTTYLTTTSRKDSVPVACVTAEGLESWLKKQDAALKSWVAAQEYKAKPGTVCIIPGEKGRPRRVLLGVPEQHRLNAWAAAADLLPGAYTYACEDKKDLPEAQLGWMLGCYRYTAYKPAPKQYGTLYVPAASLSEEQIDLAESICFTRDLINHPANVLTPSALAAEAKKLAKAHGATVTEIAGEALLKANYPTIHAVGRACADAPRLVDIRWNAGAKKLPLVTLVGKGVCFDSGGLNIKTGSGMNLMKKDMGGAAHALGLARVVMRRKLPVRLRVLLPIVENSIAGNAFRPQDVIKTRKGITVEIGNTDAEGRLILCDALAEADAEKPDLLIDMATLTGASRVALGPDIPSFFTPSDTLARALDKASAAVADPVWRLPLWQPYEEYLASSVAEVNNAGTGGYAGAITAALFLNRFVTGTENWLHLDMMAWNVTAKPGRPVGGEAQGLRALYHYLKDAYA